MSSFAALYVGAFFRPHRTMDALMLVWFTMHFAFGVGAAHGLSRGRAAIAGTSGFVVYQTLFVVFNR